jgi:pimeloyl-ACP methyl ester carboxylesterase
MTIDARTLKAISFPLEQGGTGQSVSGSDLFRRDSELNAEFRDRAPWWGGDLQTLRNHFLRRHVPLPSQSSTIEFPTSDGSGDRLTGTLEEPLAPAATSPLILLIHGLAGCEDSTYVRESARFHLARGRPVLRLNLRGAGTSRHLANGHYHAGSASDIQDVLNGLDYDSDQHAVFLVGFSLGGNILLNLLGRLKSQRRLIGAATVSAPIEPLDACKRIMEPRNALYHRFLLKRMKMFWPPPRCRIESARRFSEPTLYTLSMINGSRRVTVFTMHRTTTSGPRAHGSLARSQHRLSCCTPVTTRGFQPSRISSGRNVHCATWRSYLRGVVATLAFMNVAAPTPGMTA